MSSIVEQVNAEYFTLKEAQEHLGIGRMTLWRWIKKGNVSVERVGTQSLIEKRLVDGLGNSKRKARKRSGSTAAS